MSNNRYILEGKDRVGSQLFRDLCGEYYCYTHGYNYKGTITTDKIKAGQFKLHQAAAKHFKIGPIIRRSDQITDDEILGGKWPTAKTKRPGSKPWQWYNHPFIQDEKFLKSIRNRVKHTTAENICSVHVRRGDVTCDGKWSDRYINLDTYKSVINLIKLKHPGIDVIIHTDGKDEDIKELLEMGCRRSDARGSGLDSLISDWNIMKSARYLLVSKSMFSYIPAIFNTNTVIYPDWNMMHGPTPYVNLPPHKSWIEYNEFK